MEMAANRLNNSGQRHGYGYAIAQGEEINESPRESGPRQRCTRLGSPASGALPKINTGTRFQSSFDQVAVGIVHTTTDDRIPEVDRKLCELLGYTAAELSTLTTRELTHPDDRDQQDSGQW